MTAAVSPSSERLTKRTELKMSAQTNWWENFFTGLTVDFWRATMTPEATRAEADFFEKQFAPQPGARLLDVPCGDGRLSLELARRGYRMTGVDISSDFLEAARKSTTEEKLSIEWRQSDMRELPWVEEFDGAFCAGSSFGYFDDAGNAAFAKAVFGALKPGGRFAIDAIKAAEVILPNFRERFEIEVGDIRFVAENRYDPVTGRVENRYTITRGDRSETRLASHRVYSYCEVLCLLRKAGFGPFAGYGSLSGEPFQLGSPRLLLVSTKEA